MTTAEVASKLISFCQKAQFRQAIESLYSPDVVSVEPFDMPGGMGREMHGVAGVLKKTEWWEANHVVNSASVTGPFLAADKFAVIFNFDVTEKTSGKRMQISEVGVYTVADGKIVRDEFLFEKE